MPILRFPGLPRPSALEWLCLFAGVFLSLHYSWLMDDAFVYFRYVDNLVLLDLGLVYNQGEYVEGFTSPLWTLILIVLRGVGLNYWLVTRLLAVIASVAVWACLVVVNRRLSPPEAKVVNLPLLYLTFNYAVQTSFSSGLETPLVQLAAAATALWIVRPTSRLAQGVVGLGPLARHELLLPFLVATMWSRSRTGRWPWMAIILCVGSLAGWTIFRIVYYADILPNTFYLKNMSWPAQGFRYLMDTLNSYGLHFIVAGFAGLAFWLWRRGSEVQIGPRLCMLLCAASITAYVVKIGGDFLHYRYLAFPFILAAASCAGLGERALGELVPRSPRVVPWAIGLVVALGSWLLYPSSLDRHPFSLRARLVGEPVVEDAMAHRLRPELKRDPWESGSAHDMRPRYERYRRRNTEYRFARLVADYWCVRNYEHFNWYVVQSLGLTDPFLSRIDVPNERPGHRWHLHPLGQQIVEMRGKHGFEPGMFERAMASQDAPDWVEPNLQTIDWIDRRIHNRHDFVENFGLALRRVGRIQLVSPPPPVPTRRERKLGG